MMETDDKTVTVESVDVDETFIVKTDAGELCRLCANTDNQLIPIFRGEGLEHNLPVKIKTHLPIIKVTEVDKLPLQICYQCASTLISWNNLYEGCRVADKRLREILSIDDKYQEDETYADYVDDYRDDYDEETHESPSAPPPNTSNLASNTLKDVNSTEVSTLSDTKTLETESDRNNERYVKSTLPPLRLPSSSRPPSSAPSTVRQFKVDGGDALFPNVIMVEGPSTSLLKNALESDLEEAKCDCTTATNDSETKCAVCVERDKLKCNFCPMVFISKVDIAQHLSSSHAAEVGAGDCSVRATRKRARSMSAATTTAAATSSQVADNKSKVNFVALPVDDNADESKITGRDAVKWFRCEVCPKVCLTARGLLRHSGVHKNKRQETIIPEISCGYCDQKFDSVDKERDHVSSYHRIAVSTNDPLSSDTGFAISAREDDEKENHTNDGEDDDDYAEESKQISKMKSSTRRRIVKKKDTDEVETLSCQECDKTFETKSGYGRHMNKVHPTTGGDFVCDVCQKQFATDKVLKRHKSNVHRTKRVKLSAEEDPFSKWYVFADGQKHLKCDQCKYNSLWYHKGRFLEHYRIHTGEKPFTCDACGKQFRTKTLLQKHVMFVHEGIKEHPCDICGRCFSDKRYMEDHRRIHTGERPYVCDLCGKTFKQSASLFIHKELHKGLRKHACEMCGKRFTTRSSLTIHIKRHIGERNFICATCGKAFVDGKHLKDHMAVHSNERPFSCELCGGKFKLMKHLKQHGRTHKREFGYTS